MPLSPKYQWQLTYNAARKESEPDKVIWLLGRAVVALDRRSAGWDNEPGTKAEVRAVLDSISTLRKRLAWYLDNNTESVGNVLELQAARRSLINRRKCKAVR